MDETGLLRTLLWPIIPTWGTFLVILVMAFKAAPSWLERFNERARDRAAAARDKVAERANDWNRLRDEIARLYTQLHENRAEYEEFRREQLAENQECRNNLAAAVKRIGELEGYMLGVGKAEQDAQRIVSADRLEQRGKSDG